MNSQARQLVAALLEGHDYSSTQIDLPEPLADFLIKWSQTNIADKDLHHDKDGRLGRETEMHVTCKFGLLDRHPSEALLEIIDGTAPFTIRLGRVSFFESDDYDVVKLDVESDGLMTLNKAISAQCEHEDTRKNYIPHCTL